MKAEFSRSSKGLCRACGKPTKLLCHQGCGEKLAKEVKPFFVRADSEKWKEYHKKAADNHAKKMYKSGKLPPFMLS